ncbi:sugar transferase [Paenibacillus hemerocallicola]|uniref:Sugar transferase n=1 Tax=Paenibacillus hemerocallicola TaxID=1172614 RepID=A0A5C4TCA1_9BACL|nr:sugar transferase [Paenibacillus hemerocallicola]
MAYKIVKRVFDFSASFVAIIVLLPLIVCVGFMVRLKLGSPVLYKQQRPGLNGHPFYIYKFRTMADLYDSDGTPLPDESRLTEFGKILRRLSLDELPQLFNVIKGELSLVGPRPLLMDYLTKYTTWQARRHEVKPGMTGLAQVSGRNAIGWEQKFELDVYYVDHLSFLLDLKILMKTAYKVIHSEGISQQGHATMPVFEGEKTNETV